jgi:hypothetical protein
VAARFSKVIRSGRWVAGRHTRLTARFGALIVNLTDAVLPGREITLEIDAFCGKLIVIVRRARTSSTRAARCCEAGHLRPGRSRGCRRTADQDRRGCPVCQGRRASRALRSDRPMAALGPAGSRCALTPGHLMFQ